MLPRETRIRLPVVAALGVVFLIGGSVDAAAVPAHGQRHTLTLTLPPLAVLFQRKAA